MNTTELLEKLKDYLESEYRSEVRILTYDKVFWRVANPNISKYATIQRGLGACQFIQYLGVPFKEVTEVYETFKKSIEDIIPTEEREVRE